MTNKTPPSKTPKKQTEGLFITPGAVLHNNLYSPPSGKSLNDNKGSLKDTFKKFQGLLFLALIGLALILLISLS